MKDIIKIISCYSKCPQLVDTMLFSTNEKERNAAQLALQEEGVEAPIIHSAHDYVLLARSIMALCLGKSSQEYVWMVGFAIKACSAAIKIEPNNYELYEDRGTYYGLLRKDQLAVNDFTKCITINPEKANAYNLRGRTYYNLGNLSLMWNDFNKSATLGDNKGLVWARQKNLNQL